MTLSEAFGINSLVSSPADFPDQLINLKASTAIHQSQLSLQFEQLNRLFPLHTDADAIPAGNVMRNCQATHYTIHTHLYWTNRTDSDNKPILNIFRCCA